MRVLTGSVHLQRTQKLNSDLGVVVKKKQKKKKNGAAVKLRADKKQTSERKSKKSRKEMKERSTVAQNCPELPEHGKKQKNEWTKVEGKDLICWVVGKKRDHSVRKWARKKEKEWGTHSRQRVTSNIADCTRLHFSELVPVWVKVKNEKQSSSEKKKESKWKSLPAKWTNSNWCGKWASAAFPPPCGYYRLTIEKVKLKKIQLKVVDQIGHYYNK